MSFGLIQKWLAAGVLEDWHHTVSEVGTVQGGSPSPLPANFYLHYVFDLWVHRWLHQPVPDQGAGLRAVVLGHDRDDGVPLNGPRCTRFGQRWSTSGGASCAVGVKATI